VVTFAVHRDGTMRDGGSPEDACRRAEQAGASVVGLNCIRGPRTMLPLLERVRDAVSCEVAALPVPYRTTEAEPTMQALRDPARGGAQAFPTALDPSPAPARNWASSPPPRSRSACATWASAAAPPRTTSAP
jgi:Methionine synthase I (cobalamin-dependent), methyltransferase domain